MCSRLRIASTICMGGGGRRGVCGRGWGGVRRTSVRVRGGVIRTHGVICFPRVGAGGEGGARQEWRGRKGLREVWTEGERRGTFILLYSFLGSWSGSESCHRGDTPTSTKDHSVTGGRDRIYFMLKELCYVRLRRIKQTPRQL